MTEELVNKVIQIKGSLDMARRGVDRLKDILAVLVKDPYAFELRLVQLSTGASTLLKQDVVEILRKELEIVEGQVITYEKLLEEL